MSSRSDGPERVESHRDLVGRLFPELHLTDFELIDGGWTCHTYRVDGSWIVQLPRTSYAEERLLRQIEVLPELEREISVAVPMPELVSLDPVCMGYRAIEGVPCDAAAGDGMWPERLGRCLYDLHMVPPEFLGMRASSAEAVRDSRRAEWVRLRDLAEPHLERVDALEASAAIDAMFDDDAIWRFATCVTHGDLGPEHVLVTPSGDLAGVLDWEEAGVGDPAWDFAWWLQASPLVGERALAAYGGIPDAGFMTRAALSFVLMPLHDLEHGVDAGKPDLVASGAGGFLHRAKALGEQREPGL